MNNEEVGREALAKLFAKCGISMIGSAWMSGCGFMIGMGAALLGKGLAMGFFVLYSVFMLHMAIKIRGALIQLAKGEKDEHKN